MCARECVCIYVAMNSLFLRICLDIKLQRLCSERDDRYYKTALHYAYYTAISSECTMLYSASNSVVDVTQASVCVYTCACSLYHDAHAMLLFL
jgi:hypothetical protein